jgi:hypothetical protein
MGTSRSPPFATCRLPADSRCGAAFFFFFYFTPTGGEDDDELEEKPRRQSTLKLDGAEEVIDETIIYSFVRLLVN